MTAGGLSNRGREMGSRSLVAFFASHLLVHTHVEKAAGSTLLHALGNMFGQNACLDLRSRKTPRPVNLSPEHRAAVWLLSGHFRAGAHEHLFNRRPLRIATLRAPLPRLCSFLRFLARSPTHPEYPRFGTLPPNEAVRIMLAEGHRMTAASQCAVLSRRRQFAAARRAAEEEYLLVLPAKRVLEMAGLFAEAFGLPPPPDMRRNASPPGQVLEIDPALAEQVATATAEDAQLVAWAEENADRLLATARERLAKLLAAA